MNSKGGRNMTQQQPRKSRFPTCAEGWYGAAFIKIKTRDKSTDMPVYKIKEVRGQMDKYTIYQVLDVDGNLGPVGTLRPGELPLFVAAFGADPTKLPDDELNALDAVERLIWDTREHEIQVHCNEEGWIDSIPDMHLPVGSYLFEPIGFGGKEWRNFGYGESAPFSIKVVFNGDGSPTPYAGTKQTIWVTKQWVTVLFALNPTTMVSAYISVDGALGRIEEYAETDRRADWLIWGEVVDREGKSPSINRQTLQPVLKENVEQVSPSTTDKVDIPGVLDTAIASALDISPDAVRDAKGDLTNKARSWCGKNWVKIWDKNGFPTPRGFDQLTADQAAILLEAVDRQDLVVLLYDRAREEDTSTEDEIPW